MWRDKPRPKATVYNTAVVIDTNILADDVSVTMNGRLLRIQVALSVATKFKATITRSASTQVVEFNAGAVLPANALHIFDMNARVGDTINFRTGANATVLVLNVDEVESG